jgi:hypothetical protein
MARALTESKNVLTKSQIGVASSSFARSCCEQEGIRHGEQEESVRTVQKEGLRERFLQNEFWRYSYSPHSKSF